MCILLHKLNKKIYIYHLFTYLYVFGLLLVCMFSWSLLLQVNYLIKYVSGKEEHQLVDVAGTRVESNIRVSTEDHAHEKITSCRKLVNKKLEASKSHMGREVGLMCICAVV